VKVRVELETIGIAAVTQPLHHKQDSIFLTKQSDLFLGIASCHEIESSTAGIIALADLLPTEYHW